MRSFDLICSSFFHSQGYSYIFTASPVHSYLVWQGFIHNSSKILLLRAYYTRKIFPSPLPNAKQSNFKHTFIFGTSCWAYLTDLRILTFNQLCPKLWDYSECAICEFFKIAGVNFNFVKMQSRNTSTS